MINIKFFIIFFNINPCIKYIMIKKLHVLFFSFLFNFIFSQSYTPFLNNSKWNLTVATFGGPYNLVIDEGVDVVVGAYTYKKFVDPFFFCCKV